MRFFAFTVAVLIAVGSARADDVSSAKAHFAAGSGHFAAHRYGEAVAEFLESYRRSRRLDLLFNIGLCYTNLGDPGRATEYYRRYLTALPDAPERSAIEAELGRMARRVGRLAITARPGSALWLDGTSLGVAPVEDQYVTAGAHRVEGTPPDGPRVSTRVVVGAGERALVDLRSPWLAPPERAAASRRWLWPVAGVVGAVVVATVITVAVVAGRGVDYGARARSGCTSPGCDLIDLTAAR
jgi:hypothetical protein